MRCPKCKSECAETNVFCGNCGSPLEIDRSQKPKLVVVVKEASCDQTRFQGLKMELTRHASPLRFAAVVLAAAFGLLAFHARKVGRSRRLRKSI
jgi:hypothetical protein